MVLWKHLTMNDLRENSINQFNSWAKDYDKKLFLPFYLANKVVVNYLNPKPSSTILDVGCGTGILLSQLLKLDRKLNLYGVDIAKEMVGVAKQKFENTSVSIQVGSGDNLPFTREFFDYVTCANSFHHHPDSSKSLKEMCRVLKPGGTFVLLDPHNNGIIRKCINKILNVVFKEGKTNIYTKEQLRKLFQQAGFYNIKQKSYRYYELVTIGVKK